MPGPAPEPPSSPVYAPHRLGRHGEDLVASWYQQRGYELLARNWSCRAGEVDLVAARGDVIVFCEVKTRSTLSYGGPAEAVGPLKQVHVRRVAASWFAEQASLRRREGGRCRPAWAGGRSAVRFDVACVLGDRVEVLEAAF